VTDLNPELKNITLDRWDHQVFRQHQLHADVLRLDKIHPEISGNKWFKLKYYLAKARQLNKHTLLSLGGAYSNHLLALAATAPIYGFESIGLIRGEKPEELSHTLIRAKGLGMKLEFLSRREYKSWKNRVANTDTDEIRPGTLMVPEGGAGYDGIRGAEEILALVPSQVYSHICCAVGTGATLAGLINSGRRDCQMIGIPVLKGTRDFEPLNLSWIKSKSALQHVHMFHNDHFGGYAKFNQQLIDFMNQIFSEFQIPTDFVYTGKLFYSIVRLAGINTFPAGSRILILHSGGIQGNQSLQPGLLQF
jgi:1-aminocyclopropane-1-carboxylate deaminase/D-cysteine desulfhydrase-like pyridoxal-dependent ACC family enzyme